MIICVSGSLLGRLANTDSISHFLSGNLLLFYVLASHPCLITVTNRSLWNKYTVALLKYIQTGVRLHETISILVRWTTASLHLSVDSTNLWNCIGLKNGIHPKAIPSVGVLLLVMKSSVYHATPNIWISVGLRSGWDSIWYIAFSSSILQTVLEETTPIRIKMFNRRINICQKNFALICRNSS